MDVDAMNKTTEYSSSDQETSSSLGASDMGELPRSVRGAPPELRRLIRKKQNADSARRCRRKLKMERERVSVHNTTPSLSERVQYLEQLALQLQSRLLVTEARYTSLLARVAPPPLPPALPHGIVRMPSAQQLHEQAPAYMDAHSHTSRIYSAPAKNVEEAPSHIELPCNQVRRQVKSEQPLSPTAVNIPNFFKKSLMPAKNEAMIVEERTAREQRTQFASTIDELAML